MRRTRGRFCRDFAGRCLVLALSAALELWGHGVRAADRQKEVLVLYSTRRDAQIAVVGERELPRILEEGLPEGLDYYSEYIDRARFPDADYKEGFRDFLRLKYKDRRFDVIIAMQDLALEFVGENRNELFPDTPVVFFGTSDAARRIPNSTGVIAPLEFGGTLALVGRIQPEVRNVFVVSGADAGSLEYTAYAREQFRPYESRFTITFLTGLATKALETRLSTLPPNSIIYYVLVNRDASCENDQPLDYLDQLARVANAPIYSWVDSTMGHQIVGGSLKSQTAETDAVGRVALRVLRGEPADNIPLSAHDLNVSQVDWRELERWGISEARVPVGTIVAFREPSVWDRYKLYILGAITILVAQSVLIAGLLIQRTRRREAEAQVRGSQAALSTSLDRIRDLGARLLNAQETERSRIARELHDDISQQVALLSIDLELLGRKTGAGTGPLAAEALDRVHGIAKSVHDLSHRLHPAKLRLIGLVAAISGLRSELAPSGVGITFTHEHVPPALPPDLTLCLFRIVQEALQNALKYSEARAISVDLTGSRDALALTIVDDGAGFDVDAAWGKGLGLISMKERLEAAGGSITIRSRPGSGTCVEAAVPLHAAEGAVAHADSA